MDAGVLHDKVVIYSELPQELRELLANGVFGFRAYERDVSTTNWFLRLLDRVRGIHYLSPQTRPQSAIRYQFPGEPEPHVVGVDSSEDLNQTIAEISAHWREYNATVGPRVAQALVPFQEAATLAQKGHPAGALLEAAIEAATLVPWAAGLLDEGADFAWSGAKVARPIEEFDVVPYLPSSPYSHHHGVLDVWAKHNVPGYMSRAADNPTVALARPHHKETIRVFDQWRLRRTGSLTGRVDWTKVSPREAQVLAEQMFDAAGVPACARQAYYRAFQQHIYTSP